MQHCFVLSRRSLAISGVRSQIAKIAAILDREWPQYSRKVYWTKMVQNGPNDHFGQNDLIPNWILAFARPKWTKMVHFGPFWPDEIHFGPFWSANRTLAIPDRRAKISSEPPTKVFFFVVNSEGRNFLGCVLGPNDPCLDTEYDRARVPPYNGNDPRPPLVV